MSRGKAAATLELETAIIDIVKERAPITVRGICYALFVRGLLPNMSVGSTAKISRITTALRESGELDWTLIVDGSRQVDRAQTWVNPNEIVRQTVKAYRRNHWQDQPSIVEVWSEKSTVEGVLRPILDQYGVTFRVMKGFSSTTSIMQAADDSEQDFEENHDTIVLYIGDWDPSGLCMSERDLPRRLERHGGRQQLQRVALIEGDLDDLPPFDAATKVGDSRYDWFVANYGHKCWELDAMDPNDLRERVSGEINIHIDWDVWNKGAKIEKAEIASITDFHSAWKARLGG